MANPVDIGFKSAVAVTPSDVTKFNFRALYVTVDGDVTIEDYAGNVVTIAMATPWIYRIGGVRVLATGTTATGIRAFT